MSLSQNRHNGSVYWAFLILVRVEGIEPSLTESKSVVLPLHNTRINCLVVIEGIDPSSSAYEAGAHPSTPYHQTGLTNGYRSHATTFTESGATITPWPT